MVHRHEIGDRICTFFVAQRNSDQTEGRGGMVDVAIYPNHKSAYNKIKGQGVMGCGDGDVVKRTYHYCIECSEIVRVDEKIYVGDSYTKNNLLGKGSYVEFMTDGWHSNFSPLAQDPEYKEYLRLKRKFDK